MRHELQFRKPLESGESVRRFALPILRRLAEGLHSAIEKLSQKQSLEERETLLGDDGHSAVLSADQSVGYRIEKNPDVYSVHGPFYDLPEVVDYFAKGREVRNSSETEG